jgi:cysteine-rich repeat protein
VPRDSLGAGCALTSRDWVLAVVAFSGCFAPGAVDCPGGAVCPAGLRCAESDSVVLCVPERCGDGHLDPGEACDDGNNISGDGCQADCSLPGLCGNGVIDPGEDCDDGNDVPGDGCENCRFPVTPSARSQHGMFYDTARGRIVVYGGRGEQGVVLADTWEWDGLHWSELATTPMQMPLIGWSIAYDEARGTALLFGGVDPMFQPRGDTWQWDGAKWTMLSPATSPPKRTNPALAYDPIRQRIVMFGGQGTTQILSDTWEWDGSDWIQQFPMGRTPFSSTARAATAFDPIRRVSLFVIGGETWGWDGTSWLDLAGPPTPMLIEGAMAGDADGEVVLFGGIVEPGAVYQNRTWVWNGSWTDHTPASSPVPRIDHAMAYDAARGTVVMFGGSMPCGNGTCVLDDTWEWDGNTWAVRR